MLFTELVQRTQSDKAKRGADYDKFNGKGPLKESGRIAEKHMAAISMLKNISEVHLHKGDRFVVIGFNAGKDPVTGKAKYLYGVFDLAVEDITKADVPAYGTIKEAKDYISGLLGTPADEPEVIEEPTEEPVIVEVTEEQPTEQPVEVTPTRRKR